MSIKNKINIKGDIKVGGSVNIGNGNVIKNSIVSNSNVTQIQAEDTNIIEWDKGISEEEWDDMMQDAEDYMFNVNHNDFHTQNLVIQKNNEIYVNGEKLPHIPKLFGWSCVINRGSRLYINGREKINGEWKLTLRAIAACLFG
jgi:hypothetical protein